MLSDMAGIVKLPVDGLSHQEYVYQRLKDRIVFCDILPGTIISEADLCQEFSVSRTPVREALLRLSREGFIVIEQRKCTSVSKISLQEVRDVMVMRLFIEPRVLMEINAPLTPAQTDMLVEMKKVFENSRRMEESPKALRSFLQIDYEFHTKLIALCGNEVISKHSDDLLTKSMRYWYFMFVTMQRRTEQAIQEHIRIVDKLLSADFEDAARLLEEHIRKSAELDCFS